MPEAFYSPETGIRANEINALLPPATRWSLISTHRRVVALDSTDFTDVAAVVITAAGQPQLASSLLKRSGFNLPVYLLTDSDMAKPDGVTAIIGGKEQEWLELEAAACSYEENPLPPFFNTLTQYVEMDNSTFAPSGASARCFKTPGGPPVLTFGENVFAPICAMLM